MDTQTKKVLLIEDELFIHELYTRVLKQAGFTVIGARDGQQGLDMAKDDPDVILLDIMMPAVNGIEVLKKLKSNAGTKHIPVVMLTNLGQESIIDEVFKHGAAGYLMKMRLTPYEMVGKLKEFLAHPDQKADYRLDFH